MLRRSRSRVQAYCVTACGPSWSRSGTIAMRFSSTPARCRQVIMNASDFTIQVDMISVDHMLAAVAIKIHCSVLNSRLSQDNSGTLNSVICMRLDTLQSNTTLRNRECNSVFCASQQTTCSVPFVDTFPIFSDTPTLSPLACSYSYP